MSSMEGIDNRVGSVSETVTEEADGITVQRTVELKGRLFWNDDAALIRTTFERIEKAMQLVLVFDSAAS